MRRCLQGEGIVDVYHFSIKKAIFIQCTQPHTYSAVNSAHVSDDNIPKMDDQWF